MIFSDECVGEWPPEDALDELCYYHDKCLEKYKGPRWHCDEELRMQTKKLRAEDKALRARARVVQDSMAHVILNLKDFDFDGDDEDDDIHKTADQKAQSARILEMMEQELGKSFAQFPDQVAGDGEDVDSQASALFTWPDSLKTSPNCYNAQSELVACIRSGNDNDGCRLFAEKHIECSERAAQARFAAKSRVHVEL